MGSQGWPWTPTPFGAGVGGQFVLALIVDHKSDEHYCNIWPEGNEREPSADCVVNERVHMIRLFQLRVGAG